MPEYDFLLPFTKAVNPIVKEAGSGRPEETGVNLFSINTEIFSVTVSPDVWLQILIWPAYFVVLIKNIHKTQPPPLPRITRPTTLVVVQKPALHVITQNVLASFHNARVHSHHHFQTGRNWGSQGLSPWSLAKSSYQEIAPYLFGRGCWKRPALIPAPPMAFTITVQFSHLVAHFLPYVLS